MDGHADRPRLVGERAGDRLADPPGRVGRELVAAAPVELLDGADQAERALLDQVEERQALVAVVLGDRDDEAQVRLDHLLLRLHVAALDLLGELDLLRRGQQRVPAGLAQEELQRVGGRLERRRRPEAGEGRGLALARPRAARSPAPRTSGRRRRPRAASSACGSSDLEQLGRAHGARQLGGLEELLELLRLDDAVDRGYRCFHHRRVHRRTRPRERFKHVRQGKSSLSLDRGSSVRTEGYVGSWPPTRSVSARSAADAMRMSTGAGTRGGTATRASGTRRIGAPSSRRSSIGRAAAASSVAIPDLYGLSISIISHPERKRFHISQGANRRLGTGQG